LLVLAFIIFFHECYFIMVAVSKDSVIGY